MPGPAVQFYIQNYKSETGEIVTSEKMFQSIPFYGDPCINEPKVKNEMGKAGSFEFSMEPVSPYYNAMIQMTTLMRVTLFDRTIFRGRVLTIDRNMQGSRTVHCEGDFTFFLDSFQYGTKEEIRPTVDVKTYLNGFVAQHNQEVEPAKRFVIGEAPGQYTAATPEFQRVKIPDEKMNQQFGDSSYNTTMDRLEGLLSEFGGFFRTRYDATTGVCYLDWFDNCYDFAVNAQKIEIAKNLIDISGTTEVDNLFTVVVPLGKRESEDIFISDYWPIAQSGHAQVPYIFVHELATIPLYSDAELNSGNHRKEDYANSLNQFGQIWKIVDFPNANTPEKLFTYVKDWIKNSYMPAITQWDVSAMDLRFVDGSSQPLYCGDRVNVSHPEVDQTFPDMSIISAEYDLYNPDKNKYTIGIPNPEINTSYGVKEKKESGSKAKTSKSKPISGKKPPEDPTPPVRESVQDAIDRLTNEYWGKSEFDKDITMDNPLAYTIYDTHGRRMLPEETVPAAFETFKALQTTKTLRFQELMAESLKRGVRYDDPQLLIDFTPSEKKKQQKFKSDAFYTYTHEYGLTMQQADVVLNETTGQSFLSSLVDDDGNWSDYALQHGATIWAGGPEIKQQAINTRKILSGKDKPVGLGGFNLGSIRDSLLSLDLNVNDYVKFDSTGMTFDVGKIIKTAETLKDDAKTKFLSLFDQDIFKGTTFENLLTGEKEIQFNLQSDTVNIDGGEKGSAAFGSNGSLGGKNGWTVTLNMPYRYTATGEDGVTREFIVPDHSIAVDDIHFTKKYDSLRAKLAVVDVLLADYAKINSLEALEAKLGALTVDMEHLQYSFDDEVNGLKQELIDTASMHMRELEDTKNGLRNYLIDTASMHYRSLSDKTNQLFQYLEDTASHHARTFEDRINDLYHYLEDTASRHYRHLEDRENELDHYLEDTASRHYERLEDRGNQLYNTLTDTASVHLRTLEDRKNELYNTLADTASAHIRTLEDRKNELYNTLTDTASAHIRTLEDRKNELYHYLEDTASVHSRTLADKTNQLYNVLEDTASAHTRSLADYKNELYHYLEDTASTHSRALLDDKNQLYHYLEDTASMHARTLEDEKNGLKNELIETASMHKQTLSDSVNGLKNELINTASMHKQTLSDSVNGLKNELINTASMHKQTLSDSVNGLKNELISTASMHKQTLSDSVNGLKNELINTASQHKQTLADTVNGLINEVEDSASQHRQTLADTANGLKNEIVSTASEQRQTLTNEGTTQKNEIISTASSELRRISNATTGLEARIEQNENRIGLIVEDNGSGGYQVKPASIVATIVDHKSELNLSANDIILDGSIKLGDKLQVLPGGELYATTSIYAAPGSVFNGDHVGNFYYSDQQEGHSVRMPLLKKARVDNGVLKIWTYSDPEGSPSITFSKAATTSNKISGSWSGGIFTVATDDVNGQQPPLMTTSLKVVLTGDVTVSNKKVRQYAQVWYFDSSLSQYTSNPYQNTGMTDQQIEIDASSVYTAGKDVVRLKIVPHSGSAWNYNVGLDKSESGSEITEYAIWLRDEGLDTETGEHPISAMIGANTVSQTVYVQDYNQGQDSIINAGAPLNVTANTSGNVALNRYVTTYNVNVPAPTVKVKLDREYVSISGTIDAVVPTTDGSGYDFLRAWVQDGGLVQSGTNPGHKTRQIRSFIGSTPIFDTTYTDYKDGWDAVGTPQWGDWNVAATGVKSSTLNTGNYVYLQVNKKTNNESRDRLVQLSISGSASYDDFDSNHKAYVYVRYYDATAGAWKYIMRREIDATSVYQAGQQNGSGGTVVFDGWVTGNVENSSYAIISNQIKAKINGSTNEPVKHSVYLTQDSSFVNKKKWVWMRDNASNGTAVGKIQVDAASVYNDGFNAVGAPTFSQWQETDGTTVITPSSTAPATTATSRNVQMKWVTNSKTTGAERKATKNLYLSVEMSGSKPAFDSNHVAYVRLRDYSGGYRYIARVAVDASSVYAEGAGQVVVAKPAFEFQSGIGTQNKKYTTVTAKATSGSKTESTGTYLELQSGTYGSRSNHCINLYSEEAGDIIARYDIESMINGSAADANVVFDSWLNNPLEDGTNNVLTNTVRFRNESNSAKTAAKTIFMDYDSGFENHRKWVKVHADSAGGATVLRYQVDASSEWNAAIASPSVRGEQAGNSDSIDVSLLSGQKWKVNFTLVDASGSPRTTSYVVQAPTTGGSERVSGNWEYDNNNVPQFVVSSSPTGSALPAALTKVLLKVEHGYADAIAYAKIYKDNNSSNMNVISSQGMELEQDVGNKRVNLTTNGSTAAWIDISATYNAGVGQGYSNVHHVTPDAQRNRAVNGKTQYWNAILRSSNGTELRTVYADMNQGTGFVAVGHDYTLTSNGTHVINDIVSSITVNVPIPEIPEEEHDIDLGSVWTTDRTLSGWTKLNTLRRLYEQAKADSEFVVFEVTCGDSRKVYYMEP